MTQDSNTKFQNSVRIKDQFLIDSENTLQASSYRSNKSNILKNEQGTFIRDANTDSLSFAIEEAENDDSNSRSVSEDDF